ncbi:UDP-glucose 4-epimerase [Vibrio breoganii]|uniref:NAD-dependent epimerase/dehydratase family protein n=1 Tax=Vibrio breoganii TaxID=553239 RepID=UPI000C84DAB3|nr:NAD-dependent epimerase/dehydratase family protein [Vibrio breoganii]PMG34494.1 UDP-glucose 4-epimerase [Vibrio breoganii]PMK26357.1 UDP-glucose 4-epimerase [Vibrio breoganii]PML57101.1 UDP-glucose 4-epimerase [Vibrio breoganii]PMO80944.1 UDP-glucose 4-epimerase [Vibrio breoganii]PMP05080.1 UDP-glucose 4-epimerase [Vibrio breoganii]
MKVLVTGASGFIGKTLVSNLYNIDVNVLQVHRNVGNTEFGNEDIYYIDSLDGNTDWNGAFNGIEVVIHLAGLVHSNNSLDYQSVNTQGTIHLAQQAAKNNVNRFIFVSTIGVNGNSTVDSAFTESEIVSPHNPYASSKYNAELGLREIEKNSSLEVVIIRPTLVYGLGAPGSFNRLLTLVKKSSILPFGCAKNRRSFIAVQNLVDLLVTCIDHPKAAGHTFLVSDGKSISIRELTDILAKSIGKDIYQIKIPVSLIKLVGSLIGKSEMVEQLYGNLEVDNSYLEKVLEWSPPLTMEQAMLPEINKENHD